MRCGTISPTKPTTPDTATDAPTERPTPRTISHCNRNRSTPRLLAPFSPKVSASSARPVVSNKSAPIAMNGSAVSTSSISRSVSAPISQLMISLAANGFGAMLMTKAVSAPASVDKTMPPNMNPIGPPPRPIANSKRMLAPAPIMAHPNRPKGTRLMPKKIARTPPKAALAETPSTVGSANGLRK